MKFFNKRHWEHFMRWPTDGKDILQKAEIKNQQQRMKEEFCNESIRDPLLVRAFLPFPSLLLTIASIPRCVCLSITLKSFYNSESSQSTYVRFTMNSNFLKFYSLWQFYNWVTSVLNNDYCHKLYERYMWKNRMCKCEIILQRRCNENILLHRCF